MSDLTPSVNSNIVEDRKHYNTHTVSYCRVDVLCSISTDKKVEKYSPYLLYKIKVESGSLYQFPLTEKQTKIYNEVKRLRKDGLTYKQISNNLNERGWTTTRGHRFSDGGVHSSEKKMEKRFNRFKKYERTIEDLRVEFKYDVDKEDK